SDESEVDEEEDDPRCPTIRIPEDDKIRVRRKFRDAIIISTLGKKFTFAFMSRKIPQIWAKKGDVRVSDVGWGYFVIRFQSTEDYERAMFGGPWMVADHYVVCEEWRPYFRPEDSALSKLRVWICLPGIPLEYFDYSILKRIGDRIGKTVRIDHTTLEGSRGNFARLCVEVDLSKPLLSKYLLRRRVRRIEYEGLHTICFQCGCYGHEEASCPVKEVSEVTEPEVTTFSNPVFKGDGLGEDRPEVEEDFGPWMMVKRQPRRSKSSQTAVKITTEKLSPVKIVANGKSNNGFDVLKDLEESGDLEDAEKEAADSPQPPADFLGDKENIPHINENVSVGVVSDAFPAPSCSSIPKAIDSVQVSGPTAGSKGLEDKKLGPMRISGGKSGSRPNSSNLKPKEQPKSQLSRGLGRGSSEKGRLKSMAVSMELDQSIGGPNGSTTTMRADQVVKKVGDAGPQHVSSGDVLMLEAGGIASFSA
ncbi:hypothetical protein LINPERPRIM_LOCUS13641, partial [Linum perenne]